MSKFSLIKSAQVANKQTQSKVEQELNIKADFTHAMIVGQTGCGKTTSAILPVMNDRIKSGHGLLVFDYKGGEHQKVKHLAKKHGRLEDVVMINVPWGTKVNIVKYANQKIIRNFMQKTFSTDRGGDFWANMATNVSTNALLALSAIESIQDSYVGFVFKKLISKRMYHSYKASFTMLVKSTQTLNDLELLYSAASAYVDLLNDKNASCKS